jgi:hypothetical protein
MGLGEAERVMRVLLAYLVLLVLAFLGNFNELAGGLAGFFIFPWAWWAWTRN